MHRPARPAPVIRYASATLVALAVAALCEVAFGRPLVYTGGYVKLWHGDIWSRENSQHLIDWYTFSHVIHGFLFFFGGRAIPRLGSFQRFLLALSLETAWEIAENSSYVIGRYRQSTIALDYVGDSVVNSLSDILAMLLGFALASILPARVVVLLALVMELGTLYFIRDNLTLNVLMLVHEFPSIKQWQTGQ